MEAPVERRFQGSVRLVTLHLWRVAKSTDLEKGFEVARRLGMLSQQNEDFVRACFLIDAQIDQGLACDGAVDMRMVDELQKCAIRLNTADPA